MRPITAANDIWKPGSMMFSGWNARRASAAKATPRIESTGRSAITPSSIIESIK